MKDGFIGENIIYLVWRIEESICEIFLLERKVLDLEVKLVVVS